MKMLIGQQRFYSALFSDSVFLPGCPSLSAVRCNYLLIYEYVIGNQSNNPWKNIARAFATRHLVKAVDEADDENDSGRSTPRRRAVNKSQDRILLLAGSSPGVLLPACELKATRRGIWRPRP